MKRPKLLATLLLIGVFLLGMAVGSGVTLLEIRHRVRRFMGLPGDNMESRAFVLALDRNLKLDDAQRPQIEAILAQHQSEMNAILRSVEPQLQPIREKTKEEIRAKLRPEQQQKLDRMYERREKRRKEQLAH